MGFSRSRHLKKSRSREPFDRRIDQWFETGRQFVDGVSGNRPGKRRLSNSLGISSQTLDDVGHWVSDKLDWFLEDDDSWEEPWEMASNQNFPDKKKPLGAISRRIAKDRHLFHDAQGSNSRVDDKWPEESTFQIERWKRSKPDLNPAFEEASTINRPTTKNERRPLPRSNRRRN